MAPHGWRIAAAVTGRDVTVGAQQRVAGTGARREPARRHDCDPRSSGTHGIVAAGRHYSVSAGVRILQQGGNAVDAGVASVLAASVCEISHFGFGGEAPTMIYDAKTRELIVINGQGPAPKAATPATVRRERAGAWQRSARRDDSGDARRDGARARGEGHDAPRSGDAAGDRARRRLPDVRVPAQLPDQRAQGDRAVGVVEEDLLSGRPGAGGRRDCSASRTWRGRCARSPPPTRRRSRRPTTASAAIRAGRDTFYTGDIAHRIADADKAAGGVFTYDDLASFHGAIEKPTTTSFHGYDVYKAGPWNQGPVLLQTLNILEGADLKSLGVELRRLHPHGARGDQARLRRSQRLSTATRRSRRCRSPACCRRPYAAERRALIGPQALARASPRRSVRVRSGREGAGRALHAALAGRRRAARSRATRPASTSSTRTATCSARRRARAGCSAGAFIAGDTGVPLSNRMTVFDLDPLSPNVLVGGKRPRTTLTPTIVLKDGKPFLAISTPGGDSQDQQILNVLLEDDRVRQGHPGSDRSAADQLAASVRLVRHPRQRAGRAGDREPRAGEACATR